MSGGGAADRLRVLVPSAGWVGLGLRQVWEYRELLYFLTWRDVKVRYKQTLLGAGWAVLQPLLTMVVFSVFFGRVAKIPSDGVPYPVFAFAGLVPWGFFSAGLTSASGSLVRNANLLRKVYFPRLAMPVAAVLGGFVDMAVAMLVLLVMMAAYGWPPTVRLLVLPALVLLALAAALGVGLWLAALNLRYRDVGYLVPLLAQLWLIATPIAYPSSLVPAPWRVMYGLNPMVAVVDGFRWALVGTPGPGTATLAVSTLAAATALVSGAFFFRRQERCFADLV